MKKYVIKKAKKTPKLGALWNASDWKNGQSLSIDNFLPESSEHRPETKTKLLYDEKGIHGFFMVKDKYIRCMHTEFQSPVCRDSCVEFFFQPIENKGYFNFEFNCGGAFLCNYIENNTRVKNGFTKYAKLDKDDMAQVKVFHSMPKVVEPEIQEKTTWFLGFHIPFKLIEKRTGKLGDISGQEWRGNFYKCGDKTSHPHWAAWSPVSYLDFHLQKCFSSLVFE